MQCMQCLIASPFFSPSFSGFQTQSESLEFITLARRDATLAYAYVYLLPTYVYVKVPLQNNSLEWMFSSGHWWPGHARRYGVYRVYGVPTKLRCEKSLSRNILKLQVRPHIIVLKIEYFVMLHSSSTRIFVKQPNNVKRVLSFWGEKVV